MTLLMRDQENREEGRQEGLVDVAKTMISMRKYTNQEISAITGLSIEEVQKLAQVQPV